MIPDMTNPEIPLPARIPRRAAIKWMMTAVASATLLDRASFGARPGRRSAPDKVAGGYGTDPDLQRNYQPGELWPLTFTEAQRATAAALCDVILPADSKGPAASSVGVPDFIDEWISAPYAGHDVDQRTLLEGLAWLNAESQKRFGNDFINLIVRQKNAICDDICHIPKAKSEFKKAAQFFKKFRDLAAGGYYTTPQGMKDIGYVGNIPLATFDGPPPAVLEKLGVTQTVVS